MTTAPTIPRLASGGLITTYMCPSRCGHCLYRSGPHRAKAHVTGEQARDLFSRVQELGCHAVHIGGGEPLLWPDKLEMVLKAARETGISIDYVETNSAWFKDQASAVSMLKGLRKLGLSTLLISISPFHNAHIPFAKTQGVIKACAKAGLNVFPWVESFRPDLEALDPERVHSMAEYEERFGPGYLQRTPQRYWIHMGGRALHTFRPFARLSQPRDIMAGSGSCARELRDTGHFHVDLHGSYIPGLCAGLAVDLRDMPGPLDPNRYPLLTALFEQGIAGLDELARKEYGFTPSRAGYAGKCDYCADIRAFLAAHPAFTDSPELRPKGFYKDKQSGAPPHTPPGGTPPRTPIY